MLVCFQHQQCKIFFGRLAAADDLSQRLLGHKNEKITIFLKRLQITISKPADFKSYQTLHDHKVIISEAGKDSARKLVFRK